MRSRAEEYRRRGTEAEQRAAQATEPTIKNAFEDVASGWFLLAHQVEWLEGRHATSNEKPRPTVLQNLSKNIRECYRRAEECRRKAKAALNELSKANYLEMALAVSGPQL